MGLISTAVRGRSSHLLGYRSWSDRSPTAAWEALPLWCVLFILICEWELVVANSHMHHGFTFSSPFESHQCWPLACTNRWNWGLWRHLAVISFFLLIKRRGSFRYALKMASFSWLQSRHRLVPNVGTQVKGLACQILEYNVVFRCSWLDGFLKFWSW